MLRQADTTDLSLIGEKLRGMRKGRGWTQEDLSNQMQTNSGLGNESLFSARHISRAENGGEGVDIGFLECMAHALGTTLRELRETTAQKLLRFHYMLEEELKIFSEMSPNTSEEREFRRQIVKRRVEALSIEIFNQRTPAKLGLNIPDVEYPAMECKWCWQVVQPNKGSESNCPHCQIALCHWIGRGRHRRNEDTG